MSLNVAKHNYTANIEKDIQKLKSMMCKRIESLNSGNKIDS